MIPTFENMLDDAVLMIAYAVCRDTKIFEKVNEITKDAPLKSRQLTMYNDYTIEQRSELYTDVKCTKNLAKVTWCLFDGSQISHTISSIKEYQFEFEVTSSGYLRKYTHFTNSWTIKGNI